MTQLSFIAAVALLVALSASAFAAEPAAGKEKKDPAAEGKQGTTLYHVVSFKFKESATKEQVAEVERAFAALKGQIPAIQSLNWGTNVSPEKHDKGFTHCWVLTFASEKDRDEYLVHPDHKKFGALVGPAVADVFVVDFWSKGN